MLLEGCTLWLVSSSEEGRERNASQGKVLCEGWTLGANRVPTSYENHIVNGQNDSEGSLAIKGGVQWCCVATLFERPCIVIRDSRNDQIPQYTHSTSAQPTHDGSLAIKGGTRLHCVATLFGRHHTNNSSSSISPICQYFAQHECLDTS